MTTTANTPPRPALLRDVLIGAFLLGLAAVVGFLSPDYINPELGHRLIFAAIGAAGAFYANSASKKLTPLAEMRGDPATEQALRRFSAWSLTLGGLGYSLAWLFAPLSIAHLIAVAILGTSMVLVMARHIWARTRGSRT